MRNDGILYLQAAIPRTIYIINLNFEECAKTPKGSCMHVLHSSDLEPILALYIRTRMWVGIEILLCNSRLVLEGHFLLLITHTYYKYDFVDYNIAFYINNI